MAITNFVPEIWSASLLQNLRDNSVYAGLANRDYEGDIARHGDTVNITSFSDPTVAAYTKASTTIAYPALTDATRQLVINQANYFSFSVDDIDKRQAIDGFVSEVTFGGSRNLALEADEWLSGQMATDTAAGNKIGAVSVTNDAYDLLVEFRTLLKRSNTPDQGRFVVVPPEMYAVLLKDDRFIRADASGTTTGLRNGFVGRAAGFDIIEANTVPESGGAYTVIAGHSIATTFAEQIVNVEALRLERRFEDAVRGLHLFGAKVVRPANLATAVVTIADES